MPEPRYPTGASPGTPSPVQVLLVDDYPANLLALEAVLDGLGLDLVRAVSGEEALRLLARRDFAVVLLDVHLLGLNGVETAERARAAEMSRRTPIILLTADDDLTDPAQEVAGLGDVGFLTKPFAPDDVRARVAGFADRFRAAAR